jgi:hypothetical protein
MKNTLLPTRTLILRLIAVCALLAPMCPAATVWTGPNITFTKSTATPADTIITGKVVLRRQSSKWLINLAAGETSATATSPKDTEWAFGDIANFATLTYQTMGALHNQAAGNMQAFLVNRPMVLHLINEDIYISIKFTTWGRFGVGTVAYTRSTAPAVVAPTVSITSPADGAVFAAPANISLTANATVSGGTVTNVEYFAGTTSLGRATTAPFSVTGNLPAAGQFALTAVATAGGVSTTSAPVNISVVQPVDVTSTPPAIDNGSISFNYSVNPGLTYVVQASSDLGSASNWTSINTNTPSSSPATFSEPFSARTTARFFRIGRLANP